MDESLITSEGLYVNFVALTRGSYREISLSPLLVGAFFFMILVMS